MDIALAILGGLLIIGGLAGCILPIIPGPPFSYVGIILLHITKYADFSARFLIFYAFLALLVTVLDYIVPVWGTKRYGGTKAGTWGATIGMLLGLFFFPPFGIIFGPLAGAIIGETIRGANSQESFRAGMGSFFGFLVGVGLKLIVSGLMAFYYFKHLFT